VKTFLCFYLCHKILRLWRFYFTNGFYFWKRSSILMLKRNPTRSTLKTRKWGIADFTPGRLRIYLFTNASFILATCMPHYVKTWRHLQKRKNKVLHRLTEPWPHLTRTGNFVKFGCVFRHARGQTDRQTNRHSDTLVAILRSATGGDVTTSVTMTRRVTNFREAGVAGTVIRFKKQC